jgi:hypothetical protein
MATVNYIGDGGPDGTEFRGTMTISGTTTVSGSFSTTGTTTLGDATSDLVGMHGVTASQGVFIPVTVTVSTSVLASRVLSLIAMLASKGICASA